jgi:hypothetical protein
VPHDPQELYLHHAVLVKSGTTDLTCPLFGGERFAANGAERIPFMLPEGHGYAIRASDRVVNILHIQNFTLTAKTVMYQYSMSVQPLSANLTAVRPYWLDVVLCTSRYTISAGTGKHSLDRDYTVPQNMTLLTLGPHLHCQGDMLELYDKTNSKMIWSFKNLQPCPVLMDAVLPQPSIQLAAGTKVNLKAIYDRLPNEPIDAMGILLMYVVLR